MNNKLTLGVAVFLAGAATAAGLGSKGLILNSDPAGATVSYQVVKLRRDGTEEIDGTRTGVGPTPLAIKKFSLGKSEQLVVQFSKPDYFTVSNRYDYAWYAGNKPTANEDYVIAVTLEKSREVVPVRLQAEGATFRVDGRQSPAETDLVFVRETRTGPWSSSTVEAVRADYEIAPQKIELADLLSRPVAEGRRVIAFKAAALKETKRLTIECNEAGALVTVGTNLFPMVPQGTNDGRRMDVELTFHRANAAAPWSEMLVRVEKPNFEWLPPDGREPLPAYERRLSPEDLASLGGRLVLDTFKPITYVAPPLHYYEVDNQGATLRVRTNELAEISTDEPSGRNPVPFVQPKKLETCIILSRLSVPLRQKRVYFAMANYDYHGGKLGTNPVGSTICYSDGQQDVDPIQLTTQPENWDTDPCVTMDGSEVFFSSLHNGVRCIKKVSVTGGIPYPVTENARYIDTEPAVSKAGRLAFVRRVVGAPPSKPPAIYLQEKEQDLLVQRFGELTAGTSPSWSPNGEWLAFIGLDGGLYIIRPDGPDLKPRPISAGAQHAFPCWDPLGMTIYFSVAKVKNQRGRLQFDIWRIDVPKDATAPPGKPEPLTGNGSLDSSPACCVTEDDRLAIYFLSNRGVPRATNPTLDIYLWK